MKVFIDTNILFSAILFPGRIPDLALQKALSFPYVVYTSNYVINELEKKFILKFPEKKDSLYKFIKIYRLNSVLVEELNYSLKEEEVLRDIKDKPILRAAIYSKCDILLTGDKDFLDANILYPKVMNSLQFLNFNKF